MTSAEVVEKFREKSNKNSTNDNIGADLGRVFLAINEAQNKFTEWVLDKKNEDDIRLIQHLLKDAQLKEKSKTENSVFFELPSDFFEHSNLNAKAEKDNCVVDMFLWEVKTQNFNELLSDKNNEPSFYYRDSFYLIGGNSVRIFRSDFDIKQAVLNYYKKPRKIDLEGWTDINGKKSTTINPEWDEKAMDRIISLAVKDSNINSENFNRIQPDTNRIIQKF